MLRIAIENIDHVSLPVSEKNLTASLEFYGKTLGLSEIPRPGALATKIRGAWFRVEGTRTLHLIVDEDSTFRRETAVNDKTFGKDLSSRDTHFALRISNYVEALRFLLQQGFHPRPDAGRWEMKVSPRADAGFPQIFLMDPDRNVIELNAEPLTEDEEKQVKEALEAVSFSGA